MEEYIEFLDRKSITKSSYKRILNEYLQYTVTHNLAEPKRNDVIKYKEYLLKNLGSATVQKHVVVLRGFYRYIKISGYGDDITYGIRGCKIQATYKRQALSVQDAHRLMEKAKRRAQNVIGKRNYALTVLLLTTGIRSIEVERADVTDVDLLHGEKVLFIMGKGHDSKDAYVKLPQTTYTAITEYLEARNNEEIPLFLTHPEKGKCRRLTTKAMRGIIKELLISIGYNSKAYSVHSLRHTFATTALSSGATLMQTKEALRHKDISTTQLYLHDIELSQSDVYQVVSDAIFKSKK